MAETFCERLIAAASARPDKVAMMVIGPQGVETTTFGSMLAQIRSLSFRLSQEQIDRGDRVALLGENHPHWVTAYFGILHRGAVAVPLDTAASVEALANFLDNSAAKLAFVSPSLFDKFRAVCERLGHQIPAVALLPAQTPNGCACYEDWAQTPVPPEFVTTHPPAQPKDIAVMMYTSGTTGMPKAVPLTHGNINAESNGVEQAMRVTEKEVILGLLPLFHAYSQTVTLWLAPLIGARVVFISELTSPEIVRGLKEGEVTALIGVPRLWYLFHKKIFDAADQQPASVRWLFRALMMINGWLRDALGVNAGRLFFQRVHEGFGGRLRLAVSGGASFDARVARDFHRLGFTLLQGYGLTETAGAATITRFEDNLIGSVGTPLPGVEISLDEPNEEGVGEVLIRGPIVTPGYWRNPEANRASFTEDGWYRTGDLGRFDGQGHLYIVGRKKDVIKLPTGKQIFPEDVEAHYERSSLVSEICVLGVRDETSQFERAEKLYAVVVPDFDFLKAHQIANAREAIRFELDNLGRELPEYQRVHDYLVRSEPLPRTTTRKVRRFELKQQLEASGALTTQARNLQRFVLTDADLSLMNSTAGRAVAAAIRQQLPDAALIHPQMNLELDLGLDSLARTEGIVSLEQALSVKFDSDEAAAALTVGEVIRLAEAKMAGSHLSAATAQAPPTAAAEQPLAQPSPAPLNWHEILTHAPIDSPDLQPILRHKPVTVFVVYALLRLIYLMARLLLRLEVNGHDVLKRLRPPYLICPNHQSYLDPILVCAVLPRQALKYVFHLGASEYFESYFMRQLARWLNIVPVDPDTHLLRAMQAGAAGLRAGLILNLYPEGQRSFDGQLLEFRKGAAILATELGVSIVPVALDGLHRVWPRGSWRIRLAKARISFGEPIKVQTKSLGEENNARHEAVTAILKERIQQMLDEMRRGT
jgi:long-chain acyl-CoA synthetase